MLFVFSKPCQHLSVQKIIPCLMGYVLVIILKVGVVGGGWMRRWVKALFLRQNRLLLLDHLLFLCSFMSSVSFKFFPEIHNLMMCRIKNQLVIDLKTNKN